MTRVEEEAGRLTVRRGTVEYEVPLRPGALMIGRDARLGLCLNDASVSRRHAVLVTTDGAVEVHDLGGRNGVALNGSALPARGKARLKPGDRLRIGATDLAYSSGSSEAPAPVPPPPAPAPRLEDGAPPHPAPPRIASHHLVVLSALGLALASVVASLLVALAALRQPPPPATPPAPLAAPASSSLSIPGQTQVGLAPAAPAPPASLSTSTPAAPLVTAAPPRDEPAPVASQALDDPPPVLEPAAPAAAPAPPPGERARLAGLCLRLEGREPSPAELDALLLLDAPGRVEWLLARDALHARAWALELEHQGLAGPFALTGSPWSEVPAELRRGADPFEALGRAVSSPSWARRHLGAVPTARAVFELLLGATGPSPGWWAAQRACEGEEAELLGGKARGARELLGLALAHPDARRALQARMATRALGRAPTAAELERLAGEIEREGRWFPPLIRLAEVTR